MIRGEYEEVPAIGAGKRLGVQWCPWMGDWFTSWSPRNSNNHAEGPWDQWVDLAVAILQHDFTASTRPEAHAAAKGLVLRDHYSGGSMLTDEQLQVLDGDGTA